MAGQHPEPALAAGTQRQVLLAAADTFDRQRQGNGICRSPRQHVPRLQEPAPVLPAVAGVPQRLGHQIGIR
jgi:hypothetical protein